MTPLATALSSALLHLIWQGMVVAFLLWVTLAVLRRRAAATRYLASCAALGILALAPFVTMFLVYEGPAKGVLTRIDADTILSVAVFAGPIAPPAGWLALAQMWMLPLWACGVALLSIRLLWGYTRVSALKRKGEPAEPAVFALVSRLSERIGIRIPVSVLISSFADGPSVIGWLRPVVLLPAATLLGLTPSQLEAVLAHELAHIRRYDYLVNIVQMLIETLLFYHPAVWWISGRIRQERELCCDDIAVRSCGDAIGYARALTVLERIRVMSPGALEGNLALGAKDGPLLYRIQRLLGVAQPEHSPSRLPGLVAIMLVVACFSTDINPVKAQAPLRPPPGAPSGPVLVAAPQSQPVYAVMQLAQATPPAPPASGTPSITIEHSLDGKDRLSFTFREYRLPIPPPPASTYEPITVEVSIDQYGEVDDARVISGPMNQRRSALMAALGMRFPLESASSTRQMEVYSPYAPGTIPNGVAEVLTPVVAQARLTAAYQQIDKLKAQQAEASERGAAQLQETIRSLSQGLDNLRQAASGQNPLAGKPLENILITGLQVSYEARDDLRSKLPVHLHDLLSEDNMAATLSTIKGVYPYANAYFGTTGAGQAGLLVTVPVR